MNKGDNLKSLAKEIAVFTIKVLIVAIAACIVVPQFVPRYDFHFLDRLSSGDKITGKVTVFAAKDKVVVMDLINGHLVGFDDPNK